VGVALDIDPSFSGQSRVLLLALFSRESLERVILCQFGFAWLKTGNRLSAVTVGRVTRRSAPKQKKETT
jgi:hypothetical protein